MPFLFPFRHKLANHQFSENLVVRVVTANGLTGYGEGIPRDFVTGESLPASLTLLEGTLGPGLIGSSWGGPAALWRGLQERLEKLAVSFPAAACAMELALLDAGARTWGVPLGRLLGSQQSPGVYYSAVLPLASGERLDRFLRLVKEKRLRYLKLKVGEPADVETLARAREECGWDIDIRVDANGAWQADQAIRRLREFLPFKISAVEQPVAKADLAGLQRVQAALPIPVIADESLCNEKDAARLIELKACRIFNLRLSKCGGLGPAWRLAQMARKAGLGVQVGCHVGETSILAAAGRHFALSAGPLAYMEGSLAPYLLARDPVRPSVAFGDEGLGLPLPGAGLGISVQEEFLNDLAMARISLS